MYNIVIQHFQTSPVLTQYWPLLILESFWPITLYFLCCFLLLHICIFQIYACSTFFTLSQFLGVSSGFFFHSFPLEFSIVLSLNEHGAPGWLSRLSIWLWLRSWSCGLWVWALRWALCSQLGAWSLLQILCLPLFLTHTPLMLCVCACLSLSKINKH